MNVLATTGRVDAIFERYSKPRSPGCALAVIKDGEIVYEQGYGLANLELDVPVTPATVFNIGSMSKQFTAFAVALLEADDELAFDDDIRWYLPEMHNFGVSITVRDLIHHTSGLRDTFPELLALAEWRQGDVTTTEDVFWLLQRQRELNFSPGEEYQYTNSNYILLAVICERVSGQSFATFCQTRIFEPLGMSSTVIHDSVLWVVPKRAGRYYDDGQGGWLNAVLADSVVGPTNVHTTVRDLAKWDQNFYTGQVGGPAVVARMVQPGRLNDGTELDYAFGLEVGPTHRHRRWEMVEHGGEQGGHCSWMVRFHELHFSVVVLFNHFLWEMREYALKVADLFLENKIPAETPATAEVRAVPVQVRPEQLEKKAGVYYGAERAAVREITYSGGRLQFQGLDLVPVSENRFFFEVEPQTHVEFVPAAGGAVSGMKTVTLSGEYGYDRVETAVPDSVVLAQYAGRYYSPELDITWKLVVEDDQLVGQRRKYVDSKLAPLFRDAFRDDWGPLMGYPTTYLVVFERDGHNLVTGLRVSGSSVRHLHFRKQGARASSAPTLGSNR
jgi:CubicO group peptidase (beta-lactamase class C family)